MSWRPHQTTSRRKTITLQEGDYIGVSKNIILARLKKYRLLYEYNPRDIYLSLIFSNSSSNGNVPPSLSLIMPSCSLKRA